MSVEAKEGIGSLGAGGTCFCELPNVAMVSDLWSSVILLSTEPHLQLHVGHLKTAVV